MQRPRGVSVVAVFLLFIAAVGTLTTIVFIQTGERLYASSQTKQPSAVFAQTLVALSALATLYTWCVALGFLRKRNWARIGGIAIAILLILFSVVVLLTALILVVAPATHTQTATTRFGWTMGATISSLLAAVGIWLAIYLNSRVTKEFFLTNFNYVPDTIAYPEPPFLLEALSGTKKLPSSDAPAHDHVRVPLQALPSSGPSVPRIFVLIFSLFSIISSTFMLWHALSGKPVFYLGFLMQAKNANIFRICVGTACVVLPIGLYLRYKPAYYIMLILQVTNIASLSLMLFPAYRAQSMVRTAHPAHIALSPLAHALWITSFVVAVAASIGFVWALWCELINIRKMLPASEFSS